MSRINALKRRVPPRLRRRLRRPVRRLLREGEHGLPPEPADPGLPSAPFIVGAPRSGTTLLRLMLDAHPALAIPPETYFIPRAAKQYRQVRKQKGPAEARRSFYQAVVGHKRWRDFHLDAGAFRDRLEEEAPNSLGGAVRVFYRLYSEKAGKPRWGDKTPFYVREMALIQKVLPEARFIHIVRDGRAVALSIKDLWFGPETIEEAAEFWTARIREAREQAPQLRHYMEVRYEDLVRDREPHLRRICEFLDLPWDERVLDYHDHVDARIAAELPPEEIAPDGRVVSTEERLAIMQRVSKPPDPTRIERWKTEMPENELRRFEAIAGPLLREFGYELP